MNVIRRELERWESNHPGRTRAGTLARPQRSRYAAFCLLASHPPALDAKRRSPTKIGSGDEAAARFEKVFAQAYEVKHRCRCSAWLLWGEGGRIVRSGNDNPNSRPAAFLRRGFFLGIASSRRGPPTPRQIVCRPRDPLWGKMRAGAVAIYPHGNVGQKVPGCPN